MADNQEAQVPTSTSVQNLAGLVNPKGQRRILMIKQHTPLYVNSTDHDVKLVKWVVQSGQHFVGCLVCP